MAVYWIQEAIKHPGALRKQLGVKKGKKIPLKKLNAIIKRLRKKAKGPKKLSKAELTLLRRAILAKTLRKLRKKKK